MFWIGLTGGIGSGKSTVADGLRARGWPVIDADKVARQVLVTDASLLAKVREEFGAEVFDASGQLDRRSLGEKVFGQKARLEALEAILHPVIQREVQQQKQILKDSGIKLAFYDVPLLFEKKLQDQFDRVIVVTAPLEQRMKRVSLRDKISDKEITARIASQLPLEEKVKKADFVVDNSGVTEDLVKELDRLEAYLHTQT